jgi:F-box protein 11
LVVNKALEILGDGAVADIAVQAHEDNVLLFMANIGRIANLTLRQTGGMGVWYAVDITQGRLELEGCDIISQSGPCVAIRNGADPRLRRNRIHDSRQSGVAVHDNGLGLLEDNDITANAWVGVAIRSDGNPTLRRNQIHHNRGDGVLLSDGGHGTLEDNDITANGNNGVYMTAGSNATLRYNRINNNKRALWVANSRGVIEDNDLTGNEKDAIYLDFGSEEVQRSGNRE